MIKILILNFLVNEIYQLLKILNKLLKNYHHVIILIKCKLIIMAKIMN